MQISTDIVHLYQGARDRRKTSISRCVRDCIFGRWKRINMEKYDVVKEKLKKLSVENSKGDCYDPFPTAQKVSQYSRSSHVPAEALYSAAVPPNRRRAVNAAPNHQPPTQPASPVDKVLSTLQSRSQSEGQLSSEPEAFTEGIIRDRSFSSASAVCEGDLIAEEIRRLEILADDINSRSRQQADDILSLKRAAQQAAIAFGRQGIHDHPQLEVIERFFERYSASQVPIIDRDDCGHFVLDKHVINLRRAEEEARENAEVLRGARRAEQVAVPTDPFLHPVREQGRDRKTAAFQQLGRLKQKPRRTRFQTLCRRLFKGAVKLVDRARRADSLSVASATTGSADSAMQSRRLASALSANSHVENYAISYSRSRTFSWIDCAIWFGAAAVAAQVALKTVIAFMPVFHTALWLVPLSLFCFALYLLFIAKSNNNILMYRLVLVALGIFLSTSL